MGGKPVPMRDTYIDKYLNGEIQMDEIDDFIEQWHESDSEKELHEYLGMTWEEYALWVERPCRILKSRG
jgi:hypothetical protein